VQYKSTTNRTKWSLSLISHSRIPQYNWRFPLTHDVERMLSIQVTWLPSPRTEAQAHVCLPVRGAAWQVLLQHSIVLRWLFFIVECGIARFLCAMRVLEVRASSSPLGYLCDKFCFFSDLDCWNSPRRKIAYSLTQSINQSLNHPVIWCPRNRSACASE